MTNEQARAIFDTAIEGAEDADRVAKLELLREYFTNADFRAALAEYIAPPTEARR